MKCNFKKRVLKKKNNNYIQENIINWKLILFIYFIYFLFINNKNKKNLTQYKTIKN